MTTARTAIANQQFAQLVKQYGNGPFKPVLVLNNLDLRDFGFERTLIFRDVAFRGGIDLSGSTFASLEFVNCTFEGPLKASNCVLKGDLTLTDCRFSCPPDNGEPVAAVQLDGSRVSGSITLATDGSLSMRSAEVCGGVAIQLIPSLPGKSAGDPSFTRIEHCKIGGSIEIAPKPPGAFQGKSSPSAGETRARIAGLVSLQGSSCASVKFERIDAVAITLDDAVIRGDCVILQVKLAMPAKPMRGSQTPTAARLSAKSLQAKTLSISEVKAATLDLSFARAPFANVHETVISGNIFVFGANFDYMLRFTGLDCGGDLNLPRAEIPGQFALQSGRIAGQVLMLGTTIGSTVLGSRALLEIGSLSATDSSFHSYFSASSMIVGGADKTRFMVDALDHGLVQFRHCHFGSNLFFWRSRRPNPRPGGDDFGWLADSNVRIWRNLEITDCRIESSADFTRVQLGVNGEIADGALMLDRSRIGGPLRIASPVSAAEREDLSAACRKAARDAAGRACELAAQMRWLSLRDVEAIDVDISGLRLAEPGAAKASDPSCGDVRAERIRVAGRFSTYACADGSLEECWAVIPGALRLDEAMINELRLSENSFDGPGQIIGEAGAAAKIGIVLERAEIGRLHVPRADREGRRTKNGFPVPLDLSGLRVRNWSFDNSVDGKPSSDPDEFLDFLDNDERMHREVYRSVAAALSGAGHEAAAEQILFAEEYRARTPASLWRPGDGRPWPQFLFGLGLLKRPIWRMQLTWQPFEVLERVLTRYRRSLMGLLLPITILAVISWVFVSHDPRNFELADQTKVVEMLRCGTSAVPPGADYRVIDGTAIPDPARWGWAQQIWVTVRFHIPIISLAVRDDFKPRGDALYFSPWSPTLSAQQLNAAPTTLCAQSAGAAPEAHSDRFSAEDWFGIMSILNWIMWPTLLTFLLRRWLRDD